MNPAYCSTRHNNGFMHNNGVVVPHVFNINLRFDINMELSLKKRNKKKKLLAFDVDDYIYFFGGGDR